jgi:short-subunit dehydrogenase
MALKVPRARAAEPAPQPASEPRKVLVTGGSSGIGAATAREFAARGFQVAVTGRDLKALKEVAGDTGGVSLPGDLREPGCPQRIVAEAAAALGGLDVVVSNAGAGWSGPFVSMTSEEIDDLLDVNLPAGAQLAHLPPGAGHLVFVGSIAGLVGVASEAWYSATKAGLAMLTDVLRAELKAEGIAVTLVTPGVVDTPYFERRNSPYVRQHPRPISAQVVAAAIVDGVERSRDAIILPGWLYLPARLKVSFPGLYRLLESRFA